MDLHSAVKGWHEESRLFWSRIQTASAIEVAVLAGWYHIWFSYHRFLSKELLGLLLLLVGTILLVFICLLMRQDSKAMDKYNGGAEGAIAEPTAIFCCIKGRHLGYFMVILLIACNALLIAYSFYSMGRMVGGSYDFT